MQLLVCGIRRSITRLPAGAIHFKASLYRSVHVCAVYVFSTHAHSQVCVCVACVTCVSALVCIQTYTKLCVYEYFRELFSSVSEEEWDNTV